VQNGLIFLLKNQCLQIRLNFVAPTHGDIAGAITELVAVPFKMHDIPMLEAELIIPDVLSPRNHSHPLAKRIAGGFFFKGLIAAIRCQ
jgi:hypothetical protein